MARTSAATACTCCQLARGIDPREVVPDTRAHKSVSNETTFPADIADRDELKAILLQLVEQVGWRLRHHGLAGRTVQLKARYADFSTVTRAQTLAAPTDQTRTIWQAAVALLERLPRPGAPLRLLGVGVSGFDTPDARPGRPVRAAPRDAPSVDRVADAIQREVRRRHRAARRDAAHHARRPRPPGRRRR
jgi:DNA polymerase IV